MKLPGLDRKVRVVIDWTLDLFFPRDITLLRSRPTEVVQEVHLDKDDVIFHAGEPALSFYVVKKGSVELRDESGPIMTLRTGDHFGERALLSDRHWRFTAVAAEPSTLVSLDAKVFEAVSNASSSIHTFFEHSAQQYLTRQQIDTLTRTVPEAILKMKAGDIMTKAPVCFQQNQTVAEALALMVQHPFNSFPLLDAGGKLLGAINQTQLYDAMKDGAVDRKSTLEKMTPVQLPTIDTQRPIPEALEILMRSGRNKLLVVDATGKLAGVLTPIDLLARREALEHSS